MRRTLLITLGVLASILAFAGCRSNLDANVTIAAVDTDNSVPTLGRWTGNVYENEFAKLTFTMPGDWIALSNEEISELMGITSERLVESGMEISEEMLEFQNIYAMMAQNPNTKTNVSLLFENLAVSPGGTNMSEEDYFDAVKELLEQVPGATYSFHGTTERILGGNTYLVLETEKMETAAKQYYCIRKSGKYMIITIITVMADDNIENIFNYFH